MNIAVPQLPSLLDFGTSITGLFYVRYFFIPAVVILPFFHGIASIPFLRKGETLQIWRRNYASFKKLSPMLLPGKDEDPRAYLVDLATLIICVLLTCVFNVVIPVLVRRIVDQLVNTQTVTIPTTEILVLAVLRQVISKVVSTMHWTKRARVEAEVGDRLASRLYDNVLTLSADYHDANQSMSMYITIVSGSARFGHFAMSIFFDKIPAFVDLVVAVVAFWRFFDAHLAFVMAATLIVYIAASLRFDTTSHNDFSAMTNLRREQDLIGGDALRNWHTVTVFNNVGYERRRYREATKRAGGARQALWVAREQASWKKNVVLACGLAVLSLMAAARINNDGKVGDFVLLLQYWSSISVPIQNFVSWGSWVDDFFNESDKMIEILETKPTIRDKPDAPELTLRNGDIEFDQVRFSYKFGDKGQRAAVKDVSFKVQGGTTVAIVGETGGGKSTLLRLLCRQYDVDHGSIRVDGQDIRHVQLGSLLRHIGIVPQIISVFNDTVRQNLKYGNFDATQEDCEAACEVAALHNKIKGFPGQYGQKIGEQGTKLSGGELQRLAIARVVLRDSKIVLFDEAMSSLDSETEWKIQARLRELCADKTVVIIAHRLATLAHANLILAVKDGVIVESGRQEELLAKRGYYYSLWDKQRLQSETCR